MAGRPATARKASDSMAFRSVERNVERPAAHRDGEVIGEVDPGDLAAQVRLGAARDRAAPEVRLDYRVRPHCRGLEAFPEKQAICRLPTEGDPP